MKTIYDFTVKMMFRAIRKNDYEAANELINAIIRYLNGLRKETGLAFYDKECKRMWKYYVFIRDRYIAQLDAEISEYMKERNTNAVS